MSNVIKVEFSKPPPVYISFRDDAKIYDEILEEERIDIQIMLQEFLEEYIEAKTEKERWQILIRASKDIQDRTL